MIGLKPSHNDYEQEHCMRYQHSVRRHHSTLKFKLKKGHNSKTRAFRVMILVLQMHLVMMSKYPKFGADTLSSF